MTATLERHGFYPAGGGRFVVEIRPAVASNPAPGDKGLASFNLLERGEVCSSKGYVLLANLPDHIAERELQELARLATWEEGNLSRQQTLSRGPGNAIVVIVTSEHLTEVFSSIGEQGLKSEAVAQRAMEAMNQYLKADVPVGPHLADQLLLPMGLCAWQSEVASHRRRGSFRTLRLTEHSRTHIAVLQRFLGIPIRVDEDPSNGNSTVTIG